MDDHSIYRLEIELATDAKGLAEALQERTSRLVRELLLNRIDVVLSEHSEVGTEIEVGRLELDLGTIEATRFESEFVERAERELRKALGRRLPRRGLKPAEGEFMTSDRAVVLFLRFIESGTLPWWSTSVRAQLGLDGILDRAIQRGGSSFGKELARLLDRESVCLRLVQHLTDESLLRLVDALLPTFQPHLGRFVTAVRTRRDSVDAGIFVPREERNRVWKAVMHALAEYAPASGPVTLKTVVHDVWKRVSEDVAWMGDRRDEVFRDLLDVASIDFALREANSEVVGTGASETHRRTGSADTLDSAELSDSGKHADPTKSADPRELPDPVASSPGQGSFSAALPTPSSDSLDKARTVGDLHAFERDLEAWRTYAEVLFESDPDRFESWVSAFSRAGERGQAYLLCIPDEVWDRFANRRYPDLGVRLEPFRSSFRLVARDDLAESLLERVLRAAIRGSLAEELAGASGRPAWMPDAVTWVRRALEAWSLELGMSRDQILDRFHRLVVDHAAETHLDGEFLEAVDILMTDARFAVRKPSTPSVAYPAVEVATPSLLTEFSIRLARDLRALLVIDGRHPGGGLATPDDVDRAVADTIRVAPASRSQDALLLRVIQRLAAKWSLEWEVFPGIVLPRLLERMAGSGREALWDRLVREALIRDELERLGAGLKIERGISAGSGNPKVLAGSVDWLHTLTIYLERHALPLDVGLSEMWQGVEKVSQAEPRRVGIWLAACLAVPARRRLLMLGCPDVVLVHLLDAAQPGAGTVAWMLFRRVNEALSGTATSHRTGLSFGHAVLEPFHRSVQSGFRTRSFLEQVLRVLRRSVGSGSWPAPSDVGAGPIPRNRMIDLFLAAEAWTTTSRSTEIEVASTLEPKSPSDLVSKPRQDHGRETTSSQTGGVMPADVEGHEPEVRSPGQMDATGESPRGDASQIRGGHESDSMALSAEGKMSAGVEGRESEGRSPGETAATGELRRGDASQVRGGHEPGTTALSAEGEMPVGIDRREPEVRSPGGAEATGESRGTEKDPNPAELLLDGVEFLAAVAREFQVGERDRTEIEAEASSAERQEGANATHDAGYDEARQAPTSRSERFLQSPEAQLIRGHPWPPAVRDAMLHWMAAVSAGGPSPRFELERLLRQWAWSLRIPASEFAQKLWPILVEIAPAFRTHASRTVFRIVLERLLPPGLVLLPSSRRTSREGGAPLKDGATEDAQSEGQGGGKGCRVASANSLQSPSMSSPRCAIMLVCLAQNVTGARQGQAWHTARAISDSLPLWNRLATIWRL